MTAQNGSGPLMPEEIRKIKDAAQRATAAIALAEHATRCGKEARVLRDEAIRVLRRNGRTIPQIAEETGVNVHTVKIILR